MRRGVLTRYLDWKVKIRVLCHLDPLCWGNVWNQQNQPSVLSHIFPSFTPPARQEVTLSSLSPEEPSTIIQFIYASNAQMYSLLKRTAAKCSHISHVYSIGRSTEGRDLLVIEFTDNPGHHELREWTASHWSDFYNNSVKKIFFCFRYLVTCKCFRSSVKSSTKFLFSIIDNQSKYETQFSNNFFIGGEKSHLDQPGFM